MIISYFGGNKIIFADFRDFNKEKLLIISNMKREGQWINTLVSHTFRREEGERERLRERETEKERERERDRGDE